MLRSCFARVNVATIGELLEAVTDIGVRLLACEMTMEVFGYCEADCIDRGRVRRRGHAHVADPPANVTLFI